MLVGHYANWYFRGAMLDRLLRTGSALVSFFPWVGFLAAAPWSWRRTPDPGRRAVGLWTLTVWLLLWFSGTPRARYLVAAVATIVPPPWIFGAEDSALFPEAPWERALPVVVVVLGGAVICLLARHGAFDAMAVAVAVTIGAILVLTGAMYPARYRRDNDVRPLTAAAASHAAPGAAVVGHPDLRLSYDVYLRRPVTEVAPVGKMLALLAGSPGQVIITSRERWRGLAPHAGSSWRVLATTTVGGREMVVVGSPRP